MGAPAGRGRARPAVPRRAVHRAARRPGRPAAGRARAGRGRPGLAGRGRGRRRGQPARAGRRRLGPVRAAGQPALPPGLADRPARGGRRAGRRLGGPRRPAAARRLGGGTDHGPRPGRRVPARQARLGVRASVRPGDGGARLAVPEDLGHGGPPDGRRGRGRRVGGGAFGPDRRRRRRRCRRGVPGLAGADGPARPGAGPGRSGLVPAAGTRRPGVRRAGRGRGRGRGQPDPGALGRRLAGPRPRRGRQAAPRRRRPPPRGCWPSAAPRASWRCPPRSACSPRSCGTRGCSGPEAWGPAAGSRGWRRPGCGRRPGSLTWPRGCSGRR